MALDSFKNFAIATLNAGINSSATSVVLTSGHGARMPSVPFNATIFNATDYTDPADAYQALEAEIVRVTARSTDTLTVTRAQESTGAVNLNTGGKTYKLVAGLTAKSLNTDLPVYDFLSTLGSAEISVTGAVTATISRMHVCSGTSANYTVTLPAVSGNTGKFIGFRMSSALTKLVTLDGNSSETIDGALTRIMWANETAILYCDGTTWTKLAGKSVAMFASLDKNASQTITESVVTTIAIDTVRSDNTGLMGSIGSNLINILRPGLYDVVGLVQWSNVAAARYASLVFNGASGIAATDVTSAASGYPAIPAVQTVSCAAADTITLRAYYYTGGGGSGSTNGSHSCYLTVKEVLSW